MYVYNPDSDADFIRESHDWFETGFAYLFFVKVERKLKLVVIEFSYFFEFNFSSSFETYLHVNFVPFSESETLKIKRNLPQCLADQGQDLYDDKTIHWTQSCKFHDLLHSDGSKPFFSRCQACKRPHKLYLR